MHNKFQNVIEFMSLSTCLLSLQKSIEFNIFFHPQSPNSQNLHLQHLQIFLNERALNNMCKFFNPLLCFYTRSSLVGLRISRLGLVNIGNISQDEVTMEIINSPGSVHTKALVYLEFSNIQLRLGRNPLINPN